MFAAWPGLGFPAGYDVLLLEGGAVKGVAYAGAAHALEAGGALRQIRRFAGSSAGAMAAAALCAGCTAGDVTSALLEIEFAQLLDAEQLSLPPALRDLAAAGSLSEAVAAMTRAFFDAISQQERAAEVARAAGPEEARPPLRRSASGSWSVADPLDVVRRLATEFGLFRGQVLEDRVEALLLRGTGLANVTFAQLRSHTGRELRVTATSVTRQRTVYFDADSTPDLRVALAVRASSAVPFLFAPVAIGGELFVDGGALKNMPLDAFAGGRALALSIRAPTQARGGGVAVPTLGAYAAALMETMTWGEGSSNCLARAADTPGLDLVELGAHAVTSKHALDFSLSRDDKLCMISAGFDALADHLVKTKRANRESFFTPKGDRRRPWLPDAPATGDEPAPPGGRDSLEDAGCA